MCKINTEVKAMATNLAINEELLNTAYKIGGYSTKKETVNTALEEFIERRKSEELIQLFGKIEYHPSYNYKKMRHPRLTYRLFDMQRCS
jgi:hypothetical protein